MKNIERKQCIEYSDENDKFDDGFCFHNERWMMKDERFSFGLIMNYRILLWFIMK